jgi:hypothetical protein
MITLRYNGMLLVLEADGIGSGSCPPSLEGTAYTQYRWFRDCRTNPSPDTDRGALSWSVVKGESSVGRLHHSRRAARRVFFGGGVRGVYLDNGVLDPV